MQMAAPADRIWDLVADVTRIGEFSPETFEARWIDGASGPEVGARFRGHVKRNGKGPIYWTTCTVSACEPGREFAFGVGPAGKPLNTWSYRLESAANGTTSPNPSSSPGHQRHAHHPGADQGCRGVRDRVRLNLIQEPLTTPSTGGCSPQACRTARNSTTPSCQKMAY